MKPSGNYSLLCRPRDDRNCFRCCPPIRAAAHDHLDHRAALHDEFLVNALKIEERKASRRETSGLSCWGLGYLDPGLRLIGCLLHPAGNDGRDLRDLTGYGDKCRRELCLEAKVFGRLSPAGTTFAVRLTDRLDSFEYSSGQANPVFRLLSWGEKIVEALAAAGPSALTREEYLARWKVFAAELEPASHAYPLEKVLERISPVEATVPSFQERYRAAMSHFVRRRRRIMTPPPRQPPFCASVGPGGKFRPVPTFRLGPA
ncbi:MAG: hypothetical protein V1816_10345 [Pseudomonadota bacterium]